MANGADGSIIIDTELDNTGFQRGSDKMEKATQSLSQTVNKVGQDMANAARAAIPAYQQAAKAIGTAQQSAQLFDSGMADATSSTTFGKDMNAAERAAASLNGQLQKLGDSERAGIKTDAQMVRFQMNVEKTRDNVTQLQQQLAALAGQKVSTAEYENLAAATQKAEQALFRLYDRRDVMQELGTKQSSREWQRLEIQIKNAEYALAQYESQMQAMQGAGTAFTGGKNTAQYQQTASALQRMSDNLMRYEQIAAGFNTVSGPAQQSQTALEGVDRELQQKPGDASRAGGAMSRFGSVLKSIAGTAVKTAAGLARVSFNAIASGAKKAAAAIGRFAKQSHETALTSKGLVKTLTSMKTLLLTRLKRTLITAIVNGVRDAMQSLAKYSSSFNASMSSMKNAVKGLSGNIAVAFGNIINAIAPAITTIINLISQAISYINAFFAMLSGKSSVTVAKKQTDDYAKSLGGAAGAAKELKNEVYGFDELNKASKDSGGGGGGGGAGNQFEDVPISTLLPESVASFFSSLKAAFEAGDWAGIGRIVAGGLNVAVKSIDNWITSIRPVAVEWTGKITRVLNGLVSGFDWFALGTTISNGLNTAFGMINTFFTTFDFAALGTGFGNSINGLIENIDWATMGATFANDWNALLDTIRGLVTSVNWAGIGSSLAQGVASWVKTIKWTEVSTTLNAGIRGIFSTANSFMAGLDWRSIGNQISGIFKGLDIAKWLSDFGLTVSNFLKSAFTLATGFIQGIDWTGLATQLWDGLVGFVQSVDWNGVVSTAFELLGAAVGAASAFVVELAGKLWEMLKQGWEDVKSYFASYIEAYGGDIIAGLWNGLLNALADVGQWIYDNIFKPFIDGFKKAFGIASPSTVMEEQGHFVIDGLLAGLKAGWDALMGWIPGAIDGFVKFFSDGWESMKQSATETWEGIKATVTEKWEGLKKSASEKWADIKKSISDTWEDLKKGAAEKWEDIKSTISSTWENLKKGASEKWESVRGTISGVWEDLKKGASEKWEKIKGTVSGVWEDLKQGASEKWESIKGTVSGVWEDLKGAASKKWEDIKSTIIGLFTGARDEAKQVDWSGVGEGITTGTEGGITGLWNSFKSRVVDKFNGLVSGVKKALGINSPSKVFLSIGSFMMKGLDGGIESESKSVFKTVSGIASAIGEEMAYEAPDLSFAGDAGARKLHGVADELSGIAAIFTRIANVLTSIGGFIMPDMAAGTVAPYKTRIANSAQADMDALSVNLDEKMDDQIDLAKDQLSTMRDVRDLLAKLRLMVDGDSLARYVTTWQRDQARSFQY